MLNRKQLEDMSKCSLLPCVECSCRGMDICNHNPREEAAQTALTLLDMLKRLEWTGKTPWGKKASCCPICEQYKHEGHKPDCELGNLLKEVER